MLWSEYHGILPKKHRYTLGEKIDGLFIDMLEGMAAASFLSKEEKLPYIRLAIRKLDTVKVLLLILWETKSLDNKKYTALSLPLDEVGRMLGGWQKGITSKTPAP